MFLITAQELQKVLDQHHNYQLIDIRDNYLHEEENIGGINIPMELVLSSLDKIDTTKQVIFYCQSGNKSRAMAMTLERREGLTNLGSLEGGLNSYNEEIT